MYVGISTITYRPRLEILIMPRAIAKPFFRPDNNRLKSTTFV